MEIVLLENCKHDLESILSELSKKHIDYTNARLKIEVFSFVGKSFVSVLINRKKIAYKLKSFNEIIALSKENFTQKIDLVNFKDTYYIIAALPQISHVTEFAEEEIYNEEFIAHINEHGKFIIKSNTLEIIADNF